MLEFAQRHRAWVANHVAGKIKELRYQLDSIVTACDQSIELFANGRPLPVNNKEAVIYGFSAFANVVQTLKDTTSLCIEQLPWAKIEQLRHGAFMRTARNAATHDGHPVVSGWADGRYFVPSKIVRLDDKGRIVEIPAPRVDIRTLCVEFATDFCILLRETYRCSLLNADTDATKFTFDANELHAAVIESEFIPEFAKQLFLRNRRSIETSLASQSHDPVRQAISELNKLIQFLELAVGQGKKITSHL